MQLNNISAEKRLRIGRTAGIIGIAVNFVLFAAKLVIGFYYGSMSASADALNNFSDMLSSVLVVVGYIFAAKPADREHPFGHARMEYLCGLFVSVIVTVLGVETLRSSAFNLINGGGASVYSGISLVVMIVAALIKLGLAVFYRISGRMIDSQTLRASAADSIGDVAATSAVVLGMILTPYFGVYTDGIIGAVIAAYIIFLGINLIRESSGILLGTAPDDRLVTELTNVIQSYDGVLGIHDMVIHSYGSGRVFATVHVEVDSGKNAMEIHETADRIESDILRDRGVMLVIHIDPVCLSDEVANGIKRDVSQIVSDVGEETGVKINLHDFRTVAGKFHTNIIFDVAVPDDMSICDSELSSRLSDKICALDPRYNTVICIDRDYHSERFGTEIE